MKLFFDFFPLAVFVGVYFFSGSEDPMYPAVMALMGATLIQNIATRLMTGKFEQLHLWILLITWVLGAMTLVFRDPAFVQWKASVVVWITAVVFLFRQYISKKPLIETMMQKALEEDGFVLQAPRSTWSQINIAWPLAYALFGFLNLYVAFNYSEAFWVKFKLFGLLGMTLLLLVFTISKLFPYLPKEEENEAASYNNSTSNKSEEKE